MCAHKGDVEACALVSAMYATMQAEYGALIVARELDCRTSPRWLQTGSAFRFLEHPSTQDQARYSSMSPNSSKNLTSLCGKAGGTFCQVRHVFHVGSP